MCASNASSRRSSVMACWVTIILPTRGSRRDGLIYSNVPFLVLFVRLHIDCSSIVLLIRASEPTLPDLITWQKHFRCRSIAFQRPTRPQVDDGS